MRKSRRKVLIRIVEWVALASVLLDVVLYLAAVRPLQRLAAAERLERDATGDRILEGRSRVARLKKFQVALPDADADVKAFLRDHVPSRRRGFSRAARLVRKLAEQSGLQLGPVSYKLSASEGGPLERLGIDVTVEGSFPGLLKFVHGLETGDDFILVRELAFEPSEGSSLALRLGADLYLEP